MSDNPKPFYTELPVKVYAYDIDAVGHVNNTVYIRWTEDARTAMLDEYLPYKDLMADQISPVLLHTEIDYILPVKLFDPLILSAYVSGVKGVQMWIDFEFKVEGELRANAQQRGVFFNISKQKPCRPPKKFLEVYKNYFL